MFVSKAAMWWFFLETKVASFCGPGTMGQGDVCFEGCDVVVFLRNKGRSRSPGGRPSRTPVQPRGAGALPGTPPRPGADVCFVENEVIFTQEQRSLSLDRTKVRLQTHLTRVDYSTGVLCCQVQDASRIGPSRAEDPPHTTWRGEEMSTLAARRWQDGRHLRADGI
jgi:hypothetical protein